MLMGLLTSTSHRLLHPTHLMTVPSTHNSAMKTQSLSHIKLVINMKKLIINYRF